MAYFTTGDQLSVMVNFGSGWIKVPQETGYEVSQSTATPAVDAFTTGVSRTVVHKEWTGTISFAKSDNTANTLRDAIQAAFQAGTQVETGQINEQWTNGDGSTTSYQYNDVTWVPGKVNVVPSKEVMETITWFAPLRNPA
jgi:hypothetical protein